MSKPPLWAMFPRPAARVRARTLYAPLSTLHHAHVDLGLLPSARGNSSPSARLPSTGNGQTASPSGPSSSQQPDALSLLFDVSSFQAGHSSPTSPQHLFGPTPLQIIQSPAPPPTPPLQNSTSVQPGPRLFPLPAHASSLPPSLAALPPMAYYQQKFTSIPGINAVPAPTRKGPAHFALESAAYGIPKHRSRGLTSGPVASSSFGSPSARTFELPTSSVDADLPLGIQVGEDAYFLLSNALGVSDGVGGWAHRSRSKDTAPATPAGPSASALFSRRLMHFCADEISALAPLPDSWPTATPNSASASTKPQTAPAAVSSQAGLLTPATSSVSAGPDPSSTSPLDPVAVLQRAYTRAVALSKADRSLCGSSTALVAILLGDELRVAHLGDCALCLVRNGHMVFRSEEQQWKFNHPLQLGPFSSTVPSDAQRLSLKVQPDDILILSSDGMSDNLWDEDVLDEVQKFTVEHSLTGSAAAIRKHALPSMLSEALCSRAKRASETRPARAPRSLDDSVLPDPAPDANFEVPFARRAREEGIRFSGGKGDDISVLVAMISAHEPPPPTPEPERELPFNRSASASSTSAAPGGFSSNLTFLTSWSSH